MGCAAMGAVHAFAFLSCFALIGILLFILASLVIRAIGHVHTMIHARVDHFSFHRRIAGIWPKSMRGG